VHHDGVLKYGGLHQGFEKNPRMEKMNIDSLLLRVEYSRDCSIIKGIRDIQAGGEAF